MPEDAQQQQQSQQTQTQQTQDQQDKGGTPQTWKEFLGTLTDEQKALYEQDTAGLRSALQSERQQRGDLAKQLKEAMKGLEEGSKTRTELEALTGKLEAAEARAAFFEEASKPEIGCSNAQLAFLAAREIGAIDARGRIHWDDIKTQYPELFKAKSPPPGNGGAGAGNAGAGTGGGMNAFIRRSAGR